MYRATELEDEAGTTVVSNDEGDFALPDAEDFTAFRTGTMPQSHPRYFDLVGNGLIARPARGGGGLDTAVLRTRKAYLLEGPSLHIFVVTLRCDHTCAYCQVSRAASCRGVEGPFPG